MIQLKDAVDAVRPNASVTVAFTVDVAAVVGVPETTPVPAPIDSPAGRPVADHVYGDAPPGALIVRLAGWPIVACCVAGVTTDNAVATFQLYARGALGIFAALVATTFTENVPAALGVPVTAPVDELIVNPVGRPVADHTYGVLPPVAACVIPETAVLSVLAR